MKQILKFVNDYFKRLIVDVARKLGRLKTPMDITIDTLRSFNSLPKNLNALEVFGMYGLWHTRDYFPLCNQLEIYEWDKTYYTLLKMQYPKSVCVHADSVMAINEHKLKRNLYNFIVVDNPIGEKYGNNYFEHFNFFENMIRYTDNNGVIVLNFILSETHHINSESREARKAFYGKEFPSINEAIDAYQKKIVTVGRTLKSWHYIPRNNKIGYICLLID